MDWEKFVKNIETPDVSVKPQDESKVRLITGSNSEEDVFAIAVPFDIIQDRDREKIGELLRRLHITLDEITKSLTTSIQKIPQVQQPKGRPLFERIFS